METEKDLSDYWNSVYERNPDGEMSWFEATPGISLNLIDTPHNFYRIRELLYIISEVAISATAMTEVR